MTKKTETRGAVEETFVIPQEMLSDLKLSMIICERDQMAERAATAELRNIQTVKPQNEKTLQEIQTKLQSYMTEDGAFEVTGPLDLSTGKVTRRRKT